MITLGASLVAALVAVLGYPPFGMGWLTLVAASTLLWGFRRAPSGGVAALAGMAHGVAFFGLLMWWITRTEPIALFGLVVSQGVFHSALGWFIWRVRGLNPWQWTVAATGGWAVMELLRGWMPVGGLNWGTLGYALAPYAAARGASAYVGVMGWTIVIVLTGAVAAYVFDDRSRLSVLAVPAGIWAVLLVVGTWWPAVADGDELRVTIVQGNTPCVEHCPGDRTAIYENHLRLTRALPADSADLVVWGESSTGYSTDPSLNPDVARAIVGEATRIGAFFLVGGDRPVGDDNFLNVNMLFDKDGSYLGEYAKRHPVPFGEYVPVRPVFGLIPATTRVPRDMLRGDGPVVFDLDGRHVGSVISFEGAFSRYTRDHIAAGARLMVVATNERSYGDGPAADQLIDMTRMHAAENGVDLVQAAITGKSAIIKNGGEITQLTGLYEEAVISDTVRFRRSGRTLANLWGDWVAVLAIVSLVATFGYNHLANRQLPEGHPRGGPPRAGSENA